MSTQQNPRPADDRPTDPVEPRFPRQIVGKWLRILIAIGGGVVLLTLAILSGRFHTDSITSSPQADASREATPSTTPDAPLKSDAAPKSESPLDLFADPPVRVEKDATSKSPEKTAEKSPEKSPDKSPDKSAAISPAKPTPAEPPTDVGAIREMMAVANRLSREFPNDPDVLSILGGVHHRCGEINMAKALWEKVIAIDPQRTDIYDMLAVIAIDKEEYEKGAELCRAGLAVSDRGSDLRRHLAKALLGMEKTPEAVKELQQAVANVPQDDESFLLLGECYAQLGEFEKAKASYESAVKLNPQDQRGHYGLAQACARLGLEDESQRALQQFEQRAKELAEHWRATASDGPRFQNLLAMTYNDAGTLYVTRRRINDAEKCFRNARSVDSRFVPCRYSLARLLLLTDRPAEAVAPAEELVALEPNQAFYYVLLATAYERSNRLPEAIEAAKKAVELEPNNDERRRLLENLTKRK